MFQTFLVTLEPWWHIYALMLYDFLISIAAVKNDEQRCLWAAEIDQVVFREWPAEIHEQCIAEKWYISRQWCFGRFMTMSSKTDWWLAAVDWVGKWIEVLTSRPVTCSIEEQRLMISDKELYDDLTVSSVDDEQMSMIRVEQMINGIDQQQNRLKKQMMLIWQWTLIVNASLSCFWG